MKDKETSPSWRQKNTSGKAYRKGTLLEKDPCPPQINSILGNSFAHLGIASKIKEHSIRKLWDECVGENIARRARPSKLLGTTLYCAVSSSPWMAELNYQKNLIVSKINKKAGGTVITDIVFKIGSISQRAPNAAPQKPTRPITHEERVFIERATSNIKDDYLRNLIKRAFEKSKF